MSQKLFKLALLFTKTFISGSVGNQIYLHSGEKTNSNFAESLIFWSLQNFTSSFSDPKENTMIFSNKLFFTDASMNLLKRFCPEVAETLQGFDTKSLSHAATSLLGFFVENKSDDDIKLLLVTIATCKKPLIYFRVLLCALLNEVSVLLNETKSTQRQIEPIIDASIQRMNMRLFLANAERLFAFMEPLIIKFQE